MSWDIQSGVQLSSLNGWKAKFYQRHLLIDCYDWCWFYLTTSAWYMFNWLFNICLIHAQLLRHVVQCISFNNQWLLKEIPHVLIIIFIHHQECIQDNNYYVIDRPWYSQIHGVLSHHNSFLWSNRSFLRAKSAKRGVLLSMLTGFTLQWHLRGIMASQPPGALFTYID